MFFCYYEMYDKKFREYTEDMRKDVLLNGVVVYQYNYYDESLQSRYYIGYYIKDIYNVNDSYLGFVNNDLSVFETEEILIDYKKQVKNMRKRICFKLFFFLFLI